MEKDTTFESQVSFLSIFNQNGLQLLKNAMLSSEKVTLHIKDYDGIYCNCNECLGSIIDIAEKETNFAGQITAEYLLQDQEIIPEGWRRFTLVFLGTIWDRNNEPCGQYVPCLNFRENNWHLELIKARDLPPHGSRVVHFKKRYDQDDNNVKLITILPEDRDPRLYDYRAQMWRCSCPEGCELYHHFNPGSGFRWDTQKASEYISKKHKPADWQGAELYVELNATILEALMEDPQLIPEDWKRYKVSFILTTFKEKSSGRLYRPCIKWVDDYWERDLLYNSVTILPNGGIQFGDPSA